MKRIKNKKSLVTAIVALVIVVVGVTFALFFSSATRDNLFNVGNYNVVMNETITSPSNWMPGEQIAKTITATNNGNIQAAFRVKVTESWKDASNNDITSSVPDGTVTIDFINKHDWVYNADDGYYYYKWIIEPGDTTSSIISGVTLNADLMGNATCETVNGNYVCTSNLNGLAGAEYTVTFQKETVDYSKYQQYWDTEQSIVAYQYLYTLPEGRTVENLQVGDEVCINGDTTECFNFYEYDGNNIKLLSKYNLKVGNIYNSNGSTQTGSYSSSDTGYGLQSSEAKGWVSGQTRYGTVAFSATNYWYDGSSLKAKYGSSYPTDVYDTEYKTEPNFSSNGFSTTGYSIAYYVEEYKKALEDYGVTIADVRLLTYSEATSSSIGCSGSSCPDNGFIRNTSFWLGSAYGSDFLWSVYSGGSFRYSYYNYDNTFGVRPVIVLSKSEVNANTANKSISYTYPAGKNKDTLTVGDEVCLNGVTTECFNFIKYDGNDVVLLAKYNLNVGPRAKGTATNLQDSDVIGYDANNEDDFNGGEVAFSTDNYWYDGESSILSKYGTWAVNNVYDTDYADASGNNYSIAYYVERYKTLLTGYGANIKTARLLTYSEATDSSIGCTLTSAEEGTCPDTFIKNTSFWLGSVHDCGVGVWQIYTTGGFKDEYYSSDVTTGVRPVVVIAKSNM